MAKNKELIFEVLTDAIEAQAELIYLRDNVLEVFGEFSPIYKKIDNAIDTLHSASDLHYYLFGGNFAPESEDEQKEILSKWIDEE